MSAVSGWIGFPEDQSTRPMSELDLVHCRKAFTKRYGVMTRCVENGTPEYRTDPNIKKWENTFLILQKEMTNSNHCYRGE